MPSTARCSLARNDLVRHYGIAMPGTRGQCIVTWTSYMVIPAAGAVRNFLLRRKKEGSGGEVAERGGWVKLAVCIHRVLPVSFCSNSFGKRVKRIFSSESRFARRFRFIRHVFLFVTKL